MRFNPEDGADFGPHCRNCHKGSTACNACHANNAGQNRAFTANAAQAADDNVDVDLIVSGLQGKSTYDVSQTSTGATNAGGFFKVSQTVTPATSSWRTSASIVNIACSDDGFSFPHRTLGWKMLKDDLFGLDNGSVVVTAGQVRPSTGLVAHDIDSVCLDCHNPTVWGATSASNHTDDTNTAVTADDKNDELLLRGLP